MHSTSERRTATNPQAWQPTADEAFHIRLSLETIRERIRVARLRAADRQRLAENALAAGQEGFEAGLRQAADAHTETVRALEETMLHLERCWSRIEAQRRHHERDAMRLHARTGSSGCAERGWRDFD